MAKPTKKTFNAIGIINPHDLATRVEGLQVIVDYCPADNGRAGRFARWTVYRIGFKTDPKGHWSDGYNKAFTVRDRADKEPQRLTAIEWASNRYKVTEWEKSPFGSYHPLGTMEAALKGK